MRECTDARVHKARFGWWWRVNRYRGYPLGWIVETGWRPTERWAQRVADRAVARDEQRERMESW